MSNAPTSSGLHWPRTAEPGSQAPMLGIDSVVADLTRVVLVSLAEAGLLRHTLHARHGNMAHEPRSGMRVVLRTPAGT